MKKHTFLKCLVSILLLTSMLLTMFLGVTKSEYFKSFSKELDIEAKPDLMLEYYLYDASSTGVKDFKETQGVYKNAESFSQKVVVGTKNVYGTPTNSGATAAEQDKIYYGAEWHVDLTKDKLDENKYPDAYATPNVLNLTNFEYCGEGIIYQIKLPVDEAGYYVLNFQVDFELALPNNNWASEVSDFFTQTYDRAIGCEILNYNDGFTFGDSSKYLDLYTRSGNDSVYSTSAKASADKENVKYFEADSLYQWKTLSPSRAENVSLAFKVEPKDVDNGYVLWMWDFAGLFGGRTWRLNFTDVSVEKTMELDGSTDYRDGNTDPYFMFPQTSFVNNQHVLSAVDLSDQDIYDYPDSNKSVRGVRSRGKTSYSKGRGTFATSATANSLTFQAESIFYGFGNNYNAWGGGGLAYNGKDFLNELDGEPAWSNPVVASIPLKNIQFDTDYKVTFDLSVARQGTYDVGTNNNGEGDAAFLHARYFNGIDYNNRALPLVEYADPTQQLVLRKGTKLFSSYLFSGDGDRRTETTHKENMQQIKYADKSYEGAPLTKYDEINSLTTLNRSIVQSVNNTYCNENTNSDNSSSTQSRNWFNAVCHTEYNGQNAIHWLTFYNTTFTFNIPEAENGNIDLNDLNWVWAMDSLISGCYYRIKLENVRIEKVVKYTSSLNVNGVKIAGSQIDLENYAVAYNSESLGYRGEDENNIFYSLRGINGTGQQYQARGFVLEEIVGENRVFTSEGNIYAPIIDATKFNVSDGSEAYKIALDGFTVCQGGVAKYVFSVDGGRTWEDMTFNGTRAQPEQLTAAEKGVNQYMSGTKRYSESDFADIDKDIEDFKHIDFIDSDRANANFSDFKLVADLSKYKHQANLDVIIAAVPEKDTDCKCEILRIINFNQIRNYVNFPYDFVSDITVNKDGGSSLLNAFRIDESHLPDNKKPYYHNGLANPEAVGFTMTKIYSLRQEGAQCTTAYARMGTSSYDYEDIKTAFSDFPIYNELSITGWAMVEGGVQDYYWSADHGKTWTKCSGTAVKYTNSTNYDLLSPGYADHFYSELGKEDPTIGKEKHRFEDSLDGNFSGNTLRPDGKNYTGSKLTADLSDYEGQVVDVIFAAKPNGSDVYVPVGRIDNVGVYGAKGTFYTHINSVHLGGTLEYSEEYTYGRTVGGTLIEPDYFDVEGKPLNHVTSGGAAAPQWDLGYSATDGKEFSYTIFEPNNVNVFNSRFYNNELNEIPSGGQVSIDGYTANLGGTITKEGSYKYTLDGGETWSIIHKKGAGKQLVSSEKTYAQKSDVSIDRFSSTNNYQNQSFDSSLVFNIPALPDGAIRDLLVVVEDGDGDVMPVLHIKLKIKGDNVGLFTYDNLYAYRSNFECYENTSLISVPFKTYNINNTAMKFTFPVEREGVHTLTFNAQVTTDTVTTNNDKYVKGGDRAIVYGWNNTDTSNQFYPGWRFGTGTASMSIPKTNYITGETLRVSYNWNVTNDGTDPQGRGAIHTPWIGIVKADTLEHINPANLDISKDGVYPPYVLALTEDSNSNANYSGTVEIPNLPAGEYKVIFANHWNVSRWVKDLKSAPGNGENAEFHYLGEPIDIVVQDEFETTAKIFHDDVEKGGELYYAKQGLYSSDDSRFDKAAQWSTQNVYASNDVELYFNATKEDVKRGYIILDWDLTKLAKDKEYVLNIKNLMYCYGVKSTKHLTTDANDDDPSYKIRVPALEAGTHKFAFSSYTTVYPPIIHNGLNQTWATVNSVSVPNYKDAGAYMSVPKTLYTVGEPIHVNYSMAGKQSNDGPWISITRPIPNGEEGREVVVGRIKLDSDAITGQVALKGGMSGCEDEKFANLPAGNYKIYFRDFDPDIYDDQGRYWPQCNITDPISITVIDPHKKNDKATQNTFYYDHCHYNDEFYKSYGYVSVDKTIFRQGETIKFTNREYLPSDAVRILLCEPNSNVIKDWTWQTFYNSNGTSATAQGNLETADLAPGHYQLLFLYDRSLNDNISSDAINIDRAREELAFYGVIDITVIPANSTGTSPVMDLTYIHGDESVPYGTSVPAYEYSRNSISIDITDADVQCGYVEFEYKLENLVENADIVYSTEMFYDRQPEEDPYLMYGDYISFGEYPQSLKSPTVTILEDVVPDSRGYYMGDDGNYYAKVVSTPYGENYTFADGNTPIVNGEVYYFKVEPIKWRILSGDQNSEYLDVLCESIIVNRPYDGDSNKYAHSDVREWLNDEFYKTAFTEIQKQYIIKKEVDNSLVSTGYAANIYVSDNTNDKIYLPSYATVTNTAYKFMNANDAADPNRAKAVTDYARAKGAWTNMSETEGDIGNGIWMLRSPADSASNFIREGYFNGEITDGDISINVNAHGVAPMLRLSIIDESSRIVTKDIFKDVGNTTIYRANYSALLNNVEQDAIVHYNAYTGSYMSVPKTYFVEDEPIPVSYNYTNTYNTNNLPKAKNAWICIASTGKDDNVRDTYIRYFQINKGDSNTAGVDIRKATLQANNAYAKELENLPAGEYKIWFIYGPAGSEYWWDYDGGGNYNNPYLEKCAVTDPISIKIVSRTDPDYSLTYKAWLGKDSTYNLSPMYSYIKLEKNVFNQDEGIKMAFNGRTLYMTALLLDTAGNVVNGVQPLYAATATGAPQELGSWSSFYEMEGSKNLAPGKYKLYYAVEDSLAEIYNLGAIVTIMDITILPTTEEAPTAKLDAVYTNTDGIIVKKTINDSVMLNGLLNSHTGNYDLTDDNNKVEGTIELTDVQPNSTVQFIFSYDRYEIESDDIVCKVDEVVSNLPIRKGALKVPNYKFAASTYDNVYIYTPQTYYIEGDTITVTFNTANVSNPRILLTTDTIGTEGQYGDIWVRETAVSRTEYGTVDISNKQYDKSSTVSLGWIESNTKWNVDDLPPGEYKIWLFDREAAFAGTTCEMYKANSANTYLVTEPISIKILPKDEETLDLSMTHYSDWNYQGYNYDDAQRTNWTALTIDKTVFEEGEKIYFHIDGSWEHKWIAVIKADQFTTGTVIESHPDKEKYMRYVGYGHADRFDPNKNYLETEGLDPGQYKIIYVFGETFESAWSYVGANFQDHNNTPQKIVTIMDITVLPSD